jgi:EAL domain-containing protein (putative c-di-GMP-specific phosphodiesterase class I)
VVFYQPVVNLFEGTIVKAEALLRWSSPMLGDVEPARFIPLAEETGLIREIGTWVFMEAVQFSSMCNRHTDQNFQVSINKSPVQFMARDAGKAWLNYLAKNNFPAQGISLEITEGVLLQATDGVAEMLQSYRSAGIELALDDFGTGYSSMAYLQKFKIDYVKIDQSFVRQMNTDSGCMTIVETIIVMAHKLGLKVIAEGIEQQDQYDALKALHCDFGQGYFFTPPMPAGEFLELISQSPRFATAH